MRAAPAKWVPGHIGPGTHRPYLTIIVPCMKGWIRQTK
jgi:hypothetical protein